MPVTVESMSALVSHLLRVTADLQPANVLALLASSRCQHLTQTVCLSEKVPLEGAALGQLPVHVVASFPLQSIERWFHWSACGLLPAGDQGTPLLEEPTAGAQQKVPQQIAAIIPSNWQLDTGDTRHSDRIHESASPQCGGT